ncbi:MogA/MoaB family molybdenum cofactor biosynthesis protein [Streptomyces smyrnaeus]|uniref:MogA/MoaB family molybdenum cofactor biosynthesis protein n=1 Tax=Streptomyces smyrnaeus TaxID=1387713 RepID=A0ABS3XWA1_9ACTN|nr:MogA/MoaB family molybdenum cofactor biosynthesis protein [Streptomyces smyrnaeus]
MSGPEQRAAERHPHTHSTDPGTGAGPSVGTRADDGSGRPAQPYRALAVTASNRASAGVYADKGGPLLVEGLRAMGFAAEGPRVVPDGEPVREVLEEAVEAGYAVVLTTGGTGISPTDRTPEVTRAVLDYEIPGIPEAIRAEGLAKVPTAALSRGVAGVAGRTLVVNLPGSTGGVKDGLAVLTRLLPHAVDQVHGGDHPAEPGSAGHQAGHQSAGHQSDSRRNSRSESRSESRPESRSDDGSGGPRGGDPR